MRQGVDLYAVQYLPEPCVDVSDVPVCPSMLPRIRSLSAFQWSSIASTGASAPSSSARVALSFATLASACARQSRSSPTRPPSHRRARSLHRDLRGLPRAVVRSVVGFGQLRQAVGDFRKLRSYSIALCALRVCDLREPSCESTKYPRRCGHDGGVNRLHADPWRIACRIHASKPEPCLSQSFPREMRAGA